MFALALVAQLVLSSDLPVYTSLPSYTQQPFILNPYTKQFHADSPPHIILPEHKKNIVVHAQEYAFEKEEATVSTFKNRYITFWTVYMTVWVLWRH